jgi:hypothetical protein
MADNESIELEYDSDLGPYLLDADSDEHKDPFHVPDEIVPMNIPNDLGRIPRTWEEGKRLGWDDASLDALFKEGLISRPNPLLMPLTGASMSDRFEMTFQLLHNHVGAEIWGQLKSAAPWMAATAAVWAAGHYFGYSEVVDLVLVTLGTLMLGPQMNELSYDLYTYFSLVENAHLVGDLNRASEVLSRVIVTVGLAAFLALVGGNKKVAGRNGFKNRVAWKLNNLGRKHLPSRWPGKGPSPYLLPPHVQYGTPRSPIPLVTPRTRGVAGQHAMASAARKAGMTVAELEYVMAVTARHGVHIYIRPAGAGTAHLRASGAPAKREWMKMNTVNADDVAIGAPAHARDHVAHFKPKAWKDIEPSIPAGDRARVKSRWEKRMKSYKDYDHDVQQNVSRGKIRLGEGGVLYDVHTGRPYTGDIDFFEFRGPDGRTLKPGDPLFTAIQNALERGPTFAQHPTHFTWDRRGPLDEKIFWEVSVHHGTKNPLIWVQPSGNVSLVYADVPMCFK